MFSGSTPSTKQCSWKIKHDNLKYGTFNDVLKNVKLMFSTDVILCVVSINKCPSHALKNKIPYEMWYGHIPSMRHLKVFGSTCYALIPKEKRNSVQGVTNVSSWGT